MGTGRPQANARSIAKHQDAAQVVREHHDAERKPEFPEDDEHTECDRHNDPSVAGDGDETLAHAGEQMALSERFARFGDLEAHGRSA